VSSGAALAPVSIIEMMEEPRLLGPFFSGPSWDLHKACLKAAYALPMSAAEIELFRAQADRDPPRRRAKEYWLCISRRGGKDSIASAIGTYAAVFGNYRDRLRPGERAVVMLLAPDRATVALVKSYIRGYFEGVPALRGLVTRWNADGLELANGCDIAIHTNSYRLVRGRTLACVVFDEVAFWRSEESAVPDIETHRACLPGLATLRDCGAMLVGISSPFAKSGLLWQKFRKHYGQDDDDVLFVKGASVAFNPTLNPAEIEAAIEADPEAAVSEWLGEFRPDISAFIDPAVVETLVPRGVHEIGPSAGSGFYYAFVDPSGGSSDSMTLAIARLLPDCAVELCAIREARPPFVPATVVTEFAALLKTYNIDWVRGDRYAGEWPRAEFSKHGVTYYVETLAKSDIYREILPALNGGKVQLLDSSRLTAQFCALERRTARGGKDSIDHPVHAHDDLANAAAGALLLALSQPPQATGFPVLGEDLVAYRDPVFETGRERTGSDLSVMNPLRSTYWSPSDW
jgi:hypothetical protein